MVVGVLGILLAGSAYVPLDPSYPAERLRFIVEDSGAAGLVTVSGLAEDLGMPSGFRIELDADLEPDAGSGLSRVPLTSEALAYVIYTSGSTGRPKGVLATHRAAVNTIRAVIELIGQEPGKRCLQFNSLSFDVSVLEIFSTLGSGACLCLIRHGTLPMGEPLAAALHGMAVTTALLPASVLSTIARGTDGQEELFPLLRTLFVTAERCTAETLQRWAPGRRFFNAYGPTETSIDMTGWEAGLEGLPLAAKDVEPLPLPMSRKDIADYLGLTVETVCRTLAKLERRGAIEILSGRVRLIADPNALLGNRG
jgi:non-ribosomal peptide synthetase component F